VRLYLPHHQSSRDTRRAKPERAEPGPANQTESGSEDSGTPDVGADRTVLLIEDEIPVRALAAEALRDLGYRVMEAVDGPEALRLLGEDGAQIDLLVSDVGLPHGLNGRQVAEIARERRPNLPVLFVTGYAGSVLQDQLAPGMEVIDKPFALGVLTAKIAAMLEPKSPS
jgi:CheY-like chemotaxis protein